MKKLIMLLATTFVAAMPLMADEWYDSSTGYTWTYRINGDTAEIYGIRTFVYNTYDRRCRVDDEECYDPYYYAAVSPQPTGALVIPSKLAGKAVTSIGEYAFYECSELTSVMIPDCVTSIGYEAFSGCSGLASVTIPDSVTSIGDWAFRGCEGLTSITIPDSVTSIERNAFSGCNDSLFDTNTIPGVELVDGWAVGHRGWLSGSLDLTGARGIGDWAFEDCSGITSVTIGNGVTSIGDRAFYICSGITSVTIPDSVTSIGYQAFFGCSGLTSVTIPDRVASIGYSAFDGCHNLTSITIGDSVTSIGDSMFYGCSGITNVTIPDSVTSIGDYAFCLCSGLTSVTIPNSVTNFGMSAFSSCSGLTSVTIPDSVTSIGRTAFAGCSGLTSVTIPDSVTSIGVYAFEDCSGLQSFVVSPDNLIYTAESGFLLSKDGKILIAAPGGLTSVTIPDSVTSIGDGAFAGCSGLVNVTIPNSVTNFGDYAFSGCSGLTSMTIPDSVTSIGDSTFNWCESLKNITIPDSVTSIGYNAFYCCSRLTSVTIPRSVEFIGEGAFEYCDKLAKITLPMWCKNKQSSWKAYLGLSSKAKITYEDVITIPESWQKARTLMGVAVRNDDGALLGVFELKCGRSNKKGIANVSATLTGLDGKKKSYKSQSVDVTGEDEVEVNFDGLSTLIDGKGGSFRGEGNLNGGFYVESAEVGGDWSKDTACVTVQMGDLSVFPGSVIQGLLPDEEMATVKSGKWSFAKAASVKWAKPKKGAALPELYDEASGKGLIIDTTKGKTNLSGLKLTYMPKTGIFKGSFKVYALEGSGKKTKLKTYTVNVNGFVLDGVGYGTATCKKPAVSWTVTVE